MNKSSLVLLVLFIIITIASAIFMAANINHACNYHDRNSLLLSILWALATAGCIVAIIWILKGRNKRKGKQ
jgi:uncharacterized membrane protein